MTNKQRIRKRFFDVLESGGDVTVFANVPLEFGTTDEFPFFSVMIRTPLGE